MMLLHLIKKDILIAKKLVFITMLIVLLIPLFYMLVVPFISGFLSFLYMVVLVEIMLLQSISQMEAKNPKAPALLCSTPYTRKSLVQAKYTFFALIFAYCYIAHTVFALIISPTSILDLTTILAVLLCSVIIYGVYMPIEFKYGVVKAKFIFTTTILALSLGPMVFANFLANFNTIDFSILAAMPFIVKNILLLVMSAAIFGISMILSIKIFSNKEL